MTSRPNLEFRAFYEQTAKEIYTFAYLIAGGSGEDLAAEAYARALARWTVVSSYERPEAWVRRVIVNLLASRGRRERVQRLFLQKSSQDTTVAVEATQSDDRLTVRDALLQLSPKQRSVFVLRYWNGLAVKEAAEAMDCSVSTANAHLRRGRAKLRLLLGDAYPGNDDSPELDIQHY